MNNLSFFGSPIIFLRINGIKLSIPILGEELQDVLRINVLGVVIDVVVDSDLNLVFS